MIHVQPAPEPPEFDATVRQKGLAAIAELMGRSAPRRRGRPRKQAGRYPHASAIPREELPTLWREALPDLISGYHRRCAYLALYLHNATSARSVDHFIPIARSRPKAYEWSNFRLASMQVNSNKGDHSVLDPFLVHEGWFSLEFDGLQVLRGPTAPEAHHASIDQTIDILQLNTQEFLDARQEYFDDYFSNHISLLHLRKCAPFIASELLRQELIHPSGDPTARMMRDPKRGVWVVCR